MCTQGERVHHSEMLAFKKDLERLKMTQPDLNPGGGQSAASQSGNPSASPDIYARMKGLKKRPQSMHEVSIIPPNLQEQLQEKNQLQENGSSCAHQFTGNLPPFYFTLDNYTHYKKNSLKWFSPPFYSHRFGYKMCIGIDVGGHSVGEGTHISLLVHLLPSEHDDDLKWPFRGTLCVQIFNERRDDNHFLSTVEFTEDTPLVNSARVTGSDRSTGWGNPLFIANSKLAYDSGIDRELLKYNRLRFVVTEISCS